MIFYYDKTNGSVTQRDLAKEWLDVNGLGGYASGTVAGINTRKYHGLLASKLVGLPEKYLFLNSVMETLLQEKQRYTLTAPNCSTESDLLATSSHWSTFSLTTHPKWVFRLSQFSIVITKELLTLWQEDTVLLRYTVSGHQPGAQIILAPLFAYRNFHQLQHSNQQLITAIQPIEQGFSFTPYQELPTTYLQTNGSAQLIIEPYWYYKCYYPAEQQRGYLAYEDLFLPASLVITLGAKPIEEFIIAVSLRPMITPAITLTLSWQQEISRRRQELKHLTVQAAPVVAPSITRTTTLAKINSLLQQQLLQSKQTFFVTNTAKNFYGVTAGYHWFMEWGRDTMIALPGLTLYTGESELCLKIIHSFMQRRRDGLIPNYLGVTSTDTAYNSVDASLWCAWAIQQYYAVTKDLAAIRELFWDGLKEIFTAYCIGTSYSIKMDSNSNLLAAGSKLENVTWMDAKVGGLAVTPRYGYQVEVNALWFNFINFLAKLAENFGEWQFKEQLTTIAVNLKANFQQCFWSTANNYLYDFVNCEERNGLLRPNQIFAVALPYSPLTLQQSVAVVTTVKQQLLTPYGLRTLATGQTGYYGNYSGSVETRDLAYHNGTVWPWLLGGFTDALIKVHQPSEIATIMQPCLNALYKHLAEYGLNGIAEVFAGDAPHQPDGCINQAWSVAEVLRVTYLLERYLID